MARAGTNHKGGRPRGSKASHTIKAEQARAYVIERITKELDSIITAQIEAAKGIYVEEVNEKGERVRVFKKEPNLKAGEFLLNQNIGRSKETIETRGMPIIDMRAARLEYCT